MTDPGNHRGAGPQAAEDLAGLVAAQARAVADLRAMIVADRHVAEQGSAAQLRAYRVLTERLHSLQAQLEGRVDPGDLATRLDRLHSRMEELSVRQGEIRAEHRSTAEQLRELSQQVVNLGQSSQRTTAAYRRHQHQILAAVRAVVDARTGAAPPPEGAAAVARTDDQGPAGSVAELLALEGGAFIACAYRTLLRRAPDAEGYAHYLSRLSSDGDRTAILRSMAESDEGRRQRPQLPGLRAHLFNHWLMNLPGLRLIARQRLRDQQLDRLLLELIGSPEDDSAETHPVRDAPAPAGLALDADKYADGDPGLAAPGIDVVEHYLRHGYHEQRTQGVSLALLQFDPEWYLDHNPDLMVAEVDPLRHFITLGITEPRSSSSFRGLEKIEPEPLTYFEPLRDVQARLIAFYLPQFHPIPENDRWWGKGFTEWNNVARARPFYRDHDQPRLPGELGFYDLRLTENLRRQADLARIHGIHAFCFYVYWFAGKRLLERPVDEFLRNRDIDIHFCLCWANENWTRRWDGLDSEVLMGQSHSPEDDIAFISEMARAFADPRYVRVEGKPVLVVYRPDLLPDSEATTERWRTWCRKNGIGEIHLCFTRSFGDAEPSRLGMDAAIEFPPHSTPRQEITANVADLDPAFRGQVHNYLVTAKSAASYARPQYLEYRGVMPSWDNTPRKLERAISFYGATPELYAGWLKSAVDETCRSLAPEHRLVFINAWNEWGEGAYLEPERRRGYAYLNRTREVMHAFSAPQVADAELLARRSAASDIAIIVHLHYDDLLGHIATYLNNLPGSPDLYFSVREGAFDQVSQAVKSTFPAATVVSYPNHGRDVLPFLRIMAHIRGFGYQAICKIHSKKSRHREDGDRWRDDVYERLLGSPAIVAECLGLLQQGHGILAPAGHLLPGASFWGTNYKRVAALASRMGCPPEWLEDFVFPAGTMFWFRPQALEPLLDLGLRPDDFEKEFRQVDGTTAHAIERLIGLSARRHGLSVIQTPCESQETFRGYSFAGRTSADGEPLDGE